jgi:4-hydroxy-2-oxovalerate aldolase
MTVQLLDTTLRDGSYVVDFQLTAVDTELIAAALDANNVPFIEVGHGVGMGASANPRMAAACSDDDYMAAAARAVRNAKWGMFFIPGIGTAEDVQRAADHGMGFLRIGTNVTEVAESEPFVALAKNLGMFVSANFMKTYAATPDEVGRYARQSSEYGADIVCVVDSAGGMFPEDVEAYFEGIRTHTDVAIGFHGHNNMGLAIANTLRAVDLGAAVVDTSIRGMGRSAGNAATEIVVLGLRRRGIDLGIDPLQIMTIAEQRIDPMLRNYPQVDSIGIVSGYAQFHSSFLGTILDFAQRYSVDPRELILHVTQHDKVSAPAALVERLAKGLAEQQRVPRRVTVSGASARPGTAAPTADLAERARLAIREARILSRKYGKPTVFNIVQGYRPAASDSVSTTVVDGPLYLIASGELCSADEARRVAEAIDGAADIVLLDADVKTANSRRIVEQVRGAIRQSDLFTYSDLSTWSRCVVAMVLQRLADDVAGTNVRVLGTNLLARACRDALRLRGDSSDAAEPRAVIVCEQLNDEGWIASLGPSAFVMDALIGGVSSGAAEQCRARGIAVYRPDMRAAIHAEVATAAGTATLVARVQGESTIGGVSVAAGGMLASRGTVIVDSVQAPTRVFGVADGGGMLLPPDQLTDELQRRLAAVEHSVLLSIG